MAGFLKFMQSFGLLVARVGLGALLMLHGWVRWMGADQGIAKQVAYLNQFHTPYPQWAAWGGVVVELVGGLFLVVGLLTPLVALAVLVEQVLIICYTNWYRGQEMVSKLTVANSLGFEHNVTIGLLALLLMVFGGGAVAVDRLFRRKKDDEDETVGAPSPLSRSTASSYAA